MRRLIVLLILLMAGAACSPPPAPAANVPIPTEEVTVEPSVEPSPTSTRFARATLPPTWTPTFAPTDAPPTETATDDPNAEAQASIGGDECALFAPDIRRNSAMVDIGEPFEVFWTPASSGVFYYEVVLKDENGVALDTHRTTPRTTSFTFSSGWFEAGKVYYWTLTAADSAGNPLCDSVTTEIRGSFS